MRQLYIILLILLNVINLNCGSIVGLANSNEASAKRNQISLLLFGTNLNQDTTPPNVVKTFPSD